ncbi:GNAT family N-acetyltransferase [Salirhabdus sp. Marseille-P4669]|uniref:GNAT family N-acetyltransferase n=1 Tax=Salirhabdus sp. Marseille-P4669 TaxID=2042310 RepID=UPI000C7AE7E7|nr:GNAT family N-acetyltransferase [Salirhabdus sp. Marseille-P4669]
MTNITVRRSRKEDFQALMEIDQFIWNETNTPAVTIFETVEKYEKHFPEGSQFVAISNGEICGYIGYKSPIPIPSNSHVVEIDMGVHPDFKRQGVGTALIAFVENWAKENKKRKLSLRVLSTNPGAISFYRANGFKEQGRLVGEFLINGKLVDDILMYKLL